MASTAVTAAQAELISSLSQDEIPIKLRCAICSRLAVNAFRLPCCDQAICESCQSTLPTSCPVCEHTPVSAEDCKPNKPLRTTIKVFLRTEEKKREALRIKEAKITPPITPSEPIPALTTPVIETPVELVLEAQADIRAEVTPLPNQVDESLVNPEEIAQAEQDIPQPSIEEIAPGQEPTQEGDADQAEDTAEGDGEAQNGETDANGVSQPSGFGTGFGFDPSAAGSFPGMGIGGDFNQMQMLMAMQNGMSPNAFGTFPMMGMPGMNMDPMAMQNMMMSGGFGGAMGMNGMNMGMGMTGFDGGAGAGFNNGWNGQQSWNVGQDNFNHPNAAGMGHGDYGSNNSGYNSQSAGYNQGNYGRGQYNDYQNNSYGYRGRGRGRGYNRGGYGSGSHDQFSQQYPQQFGSSQANGLTSENGFVPTGPKATVPDANAGDVDEFGREIRHKTEAEEVAPDDPEKPKDEEAPADANDTTDIGEKNGDPTEVKEDTKEVAASFDDSYPKPIQTLDEVESVSYGPNGTYNAASRGGFSGGFQGRANNFNNNQAPFVKPVDVPLNAPTGPKAMRAGLPNTGISGLRASQAFSTASTAPSVARVNGSASVAPEPTPPEKDSKEKERSRSPSRERSRSRERKRSRSRDRHGRSHRHRSRTPLTEEEKETERRRERRRKEKDERRERDRRDRHSRKEDGDDYEEILDKPVDDGVKEGRIVEERSRSASPSDSKRSSHRSRRDKEKYRERDREDRDKYRDDDREYRSSHKHRSTRRHHDDRSRSRDRSRDRDREHRHRRSRHASEEYSDRASKADKSIPPTPIEAEAPPLPAAPSRRPSTNGIGIEIKGASSRRKASTILEEKEPIAIPTGPRGDRNNARILQEKENNKPSSRRHEDEDRHRSSRHRDSDRPPSTSTSNTNPTPKPAPRAPAQPISAPPVQDPHTLEREARNRERLLKEAQRIAGMTGMAAGRKRSRDDGEDTSARMGGKGRNKKRGRGEESDEARIARLEAEREGARWG